MFTIKLYFTIIFFYLLSSKLFEDENNNLSTVENSTYRIKSKFFINIVRNLRVVEEYETSMSTLKCAF